MGTKLSNRNTSSEPNSVSSTNRSMSGRVAKKRMATRAQLLESAYLVMAKSGVDGAKIKDVTEHADVGFGTFYNYFETKDELAAQVLDCLINDYGRRNVIATRELQDSKPELVMPVSMRLVIREAMTVPMWQWWALRPDLLADRMRKGFATFAKRDMLRAMKLGIFNLDRDAIDSAWALAVWMMVAGIHDVVVGDSLPESETFVVESIARVMGVPIELAREISTTPLPKYPQRSIDWNFILSA